MKKSFIEKVLFVVVLYKQQLEDSLTLKSLNEKLRIWNICADVVVYDNSPQESGLLPNFSWENFNIIYHHDANNPGVSTAYNYGATLALDLQKEWLLLLDQDTTFEADYLDKNILAIAKYPDVSLFAPVLKLKNGIIFSPSIPKHKRGYPPKNVTYGKLSLWQFSPVNSGVLIKTELFHAAGGYNEKVKLDFSDFQFMERVRKIDDHFVLVESVALQDFSSFEPSIKKQETRFIQYLDDAYYADKPHFSDKIGFFYAVSRHAFGLTIKLKSFSFLSLYIRKFIIR